MICGGMLPVGIHDRIEVLLAEALEHDCVCNAKRFCSALWLASVGSALVLARLARRFGITGSVQKFDLLTRSVMFWMLGSPRCLEIED